MTRDPADNEGGIYPRGFTQSTDWPWPLVRSRNLVSLNYGKALLGGNRNLGAVPVYGTNGRCGWHDDALVEGPTVILGRKGQGPLGVEWCSSGCWVIDTAYYVTPRTSEIDLRYFYYVVKYVGLNHLKDGTSNPGLSRETFGDLLIPVPPIAIQHAIAELLTDLDYKIELNQKTNRSLEAIARAVFKAWFIDFLPVKAKIVGATKFQGMPRFDFERLPAELVDSDMGPVPGGWQVTPLSKLIELFGGGTPKRKVSEYWAGDIPWFSVRDAPAEGDIWVIDTTEHITQAGVDNSSAKVVRSGTTIISARGTVGRLALMGVPMALNQSCYGVQGADGAGDYFT